MWPHTTRGSIVAAASLPVSAVVLLLAACGEDGFGPQTPPSYRIVEGACGDVVFAERIAIDSASAIAVVETRKAEQYGDVRIDPYRLEVVDEQGEAPRPRFFSLRVLDEATGSLLHSISEVITTDGDLFRLLWWPD